MHSIPFPDSRPLDFEPTVPSPLTGIPVLRKASERGLPAGSASGPTLSPMAHEWLVHVPPRFQPLATARRFPHIVNRLAALWDRDPQLLAAYFNELLLSTRQNRAGFPFDVLTELSDLQTYVEQQSHRAARGL